MKMYRVRQRITEQALVFDLIEAELARRSPDVWNVEAASS